MQSACCLCHSFSLVGRSSFTRVWTTPEHCSYLMHVPSCVSIRSNLQRWNVTVTVWQTFCSCHPRLSDVRFTISSSVLHHEPPSRSHMTLMKNHLLLIHHDVSNVKSDRGISFFIAAICRDVLCSNRPTAIKPTSIVMRTRLRLRCVCAVLFYS